MTKAIVVSLLSLCLFVAVAPQQPADGGSSLSDGITLYEQGDFEGAIRALRVASKKTKKDPKPWHYLGLALLRQGNRKAAYEAFDQSIGMRERLIRIEFDREDETWRDDQLRDLKTLLHDQVEDQTKMLDLVTEPSALKVAELVLERSRVLTECLEENTKVVGEHAEVKKDDLKFEKMRILSKNPPRYPESAREEQLNGTVTLRVTLAADGSVQNIEVLRSPDNRLTEEAIKAARLIKFIPETICGKPVSRSVPVDYSFHTSP